MVLYNESFSGKIYCSCTKHAPLSVTAAKTINRFTNVLHTRFVLRMFHGALAVWPSFANRDVLR